MPPPIWVQYDKSEGPFPGVFGDASLLSPDSSFSPSFMSLMGKTSVSSVSRFSYTNDPSWLARLVRSSKALCVKKRKNLAHEERILYRSCKHVECVTSRRSSVVVEQRTASVMSNGSGSCSLFLVSVLCCWCGKRKKQHYLSEDEMVLVALFNRLKNVSLAGLFVLGVVDTRLYLLVWVGHDLFGVLALVSSFHMEKENSIPKAWTRRKS